MKKCFWCGALSVNADEVCGICGRSFSETPGNADLGHRGRLSGFAGKVFGLIILASGIVLIPLGLGGAFTFAGCGQEAPGCVNVYSLDLLSIVAGLAGVAIGIRILRHRRPSGS